MDRSFGEGYISKVKQVQQQSRQNEGEFDEQKASVATIAGDVALNELQTILLTLNGVFLLIIPTISYVLAKRTLKPVELTLNAQRQFVSDASHELKTPLSILNGEMDVVLKKKRKAEDYRKIILSSKEEIVRLSNLVENLLFLARNGQSKLLTLNETVDLTDTITTVMNQLQKRIKEKSLAVTFRPAKESVSIHGQPDLLQQLIFNLLDNAVKYTSPNGSIVIRLDWRLNEAIISIQDSGIGIPVFEQEKIFDRFYRVDTSRSKVKGYGLGLSIVKEVVEKHRGKIQIESEIEKGTTFTVILPYV